MFIVLVASLLTNAFLTWSIFRNTRTVEVQLASPDRIEVIRTKGGLLQVSTLKSAETFQASKDHQIFGLVSLGSTVTQIRVPAVFNYHVELAPEWKVLVRDKTFIVIAPSVKPTLPVAIDTARLQRFSSGTWSFMTGTSELDSLQRSITQTLSVKASTPAYIQYQREVARKTVGEFVEKWLITQGKWEKNHGETIRVFFADEPIGSLGQLPLTIANNK